MPELNGFYEKNNSTLHIDVCNLQEFRDLLKQAQKEADALQKTMHRLEMFTLDIKFAET